MDLRLGDELRDTRISLVSIQQLMSNNSSIVQHPGSLFQGRPFLSLLVTLKEGAGSLHITLSSSSLPALFCEFDKQFDKQELTWAFYVLNKHRDTRTTLAKCETSKKHRGSAVQGCVTCLQSRLHREITVRAIRKGCGRSMLAFQHTLR